MSQPDQHPTQSGRNRLLLEFLVIDVIALVVMSLACLVLGAPEVIVGLVGGYFLGFQTGGET